MASERPSVLDRVQTFPTEGDVIACHWLGKQPVFVLAEERVLFGTARTPVLLHGGGILCSHADRQRLVTGGDDGKVMVLDESGEAKEFARVSGWVDTVAAGPSGAAAWSSGRKAEMREPKGEVKSLALASAVGGLAFFPKGMRLAIAHYNGVSLWFPNSVGTKPEFLEWKGSHLGITVSHDARFVVTTMQEPQLHGWRLSDGRNMRMQGYPGKIRSFDWSVGGKFLATAGANCAVLWPFSSKDGPMGQQPALLAPGIDEATKVARVACHPKTDVVALGYDDGMILLVRIDDGAEILLRKPDGKPVSGLAWRFDGQGLAFGIEGGLAGLADL